MDDLGPIFTAHLFPKIESKLIELLHSLTPEEWEAQTIAPKWKVKDVAAHLLDTQLRKLSIARDGCMREPPKIDSTFNLAAFINRLNHEGVAIYGHLSPPVLVSLMESASRESAAYHQSLDPFLPAAFCVSWAGEETSLNWFDTARELTERWHHQQQIRLAVNRQGILTPELYHPVLDCFLRALPYAYRDISAEPDALVQFDISGDCGGTWWLYRHVSRWRLLSKPSGNLVSKIEIPQEIAWRIFTKGIDKASAEAAIRIGENKLALHILSMKSIIG